MAIWPVTSSHPRVISKGETAAPPIHSRSLRLAVLLVIASVTVLLFSSTNLDEQIVETSSSHAVISTTTAASLSTDNDPKPARRGSELQEEGSLAAYLDAASPYRWDISDSWHPKMADNATTTEPMERSRAAIAIMSRRINTTIAETQLKDLDSLFEDGLTSDVIFLHEDYPSIYDIDHLKSRTKRRVNFINLNQYFAHMPPGYDPYTNEPAFQRGPKWAYTRMCHLWFSDIFHHPVLRDVKYLMRLDSDVLVADKWPDIFSIMREKGSVYMSQIGHVEYSWILPGTIEMEPLTKNFLEEYGLTPAHPELWETSFRNDEKGRRSVSTFFTHFEIYDMDFMLRPEVQKFNAAVGSSYGIYKHRWGDAPLRYLTMAVFAKPGEVLFNHKDVGLVYIHGGHPPTRRY